ncbi:cation-transporting P-type ATPase [Candidatus Peregrinibacteria bacterium]|nr:cation-transporting P-type ATPase [Candidatus Peregrinibacteria bacterium]
MREIINADANFLFTGSGYDPMEGAFLLENNEHPLDLKNLQKEHPNKFFSLELLCRTATLCNNGNIVDNEKTPERDIFVLGDPTEGSLLTMASKAGFDTEYIKHQNKRMYELLFDSQRKMMTTLHLHGKKIMAYTKGAPDQLLEKCNMLVINGKIEPMTAELKEKMLKENERMASKALRVLGFAFRELAPIRKKEYTKEEVEKNLTFIGLAGIIDPPRKEVKEAIELTKKAGIKVYIVTGDYGNTALAIAKEIGLIDEQNDIQKNNSEKTIKIITGSELQDMDTEKLKQIFTLHENIIFARVSPEHKLKIVNTLKEMNLVVAVTGDGVNDAPALKRADIGIAMGIMGTDVSKQTANMILTDDSFSTIVTAIKEGRNIYENLKKCILYTFACNIGELIMIFGAIMMNLPSPLTAILILSVNIGTDVLPALALGIDPPQDDIMKSVPRNHEERILSKKYIAHFMYLGLFIGLMVTGIFIYTLIKNGWNWGESLASDNPIYLKASTIAFAFLVLIQMVQAFNARSQKQSLFKLGIFSNKHLIGAVVISIVMLLAFVHLPIMQRLVHTVDLTFKEWGMIIAGSLSIFIIEEIRKIITKKLKSTS